MSQKQKPNAQDQFEKTTPLIGAKTTFLEAYPQVASLELIVTASPVGFGRVESYVYSLDRPPGEYCPCPNPACRNGGARLGGFLYRLISARKTEGEEQMGCVGSEPMGRGSSRSCFYGFHLKAKIDYREEDTTEAAIPPPGHDGETPNPV